MGRRHAQELKAQSMARGGALGKAHGQPVHRRRHAGRRDAAGNGMHRLAAPLILCALVFQADPPR
jgi:hypothetical protein